MSGLTLPFNVPGEYQSTYTVSLIKNHFNKTITVTVRWFGIESAHAFKPQLSWNECILIIKNHSKTLLCTLVSAVPGA